MKRLLILVLGLVAFFAFSGLSAAFEDEVTQGICRPAWVIGKVTHVDGNTAIVDLNNRRIVALDFNHSAVGVCSGVQNNPEVSTFPAVGNSVAIAARISASCEECLATC